MGQPSSEVVRNLGLRVRLSCVWMAACESGDLGPVTHPLSLTVLICKMRTSQGILEMKWACRGRHRAVPTTHRRPQQPLFCVDIPRVVEAWMTSPVSGLLGGHFPFRKHPPSFPGTRIGTGHYFKKTTQKMFQAHWYASHSFLPGRMKNI